MNNFGKWTAILSYDAIQALLSTADPAITFFTNQLLDISAGDASDRVWKLPEPTKLVRSQADDGSWRYKGNRPGDAYGEKYELLAT